MAITKILLSGGGTDGKPLQSDGNNQTIHTASSTATDLDEVWLWGANILGTDSEATVGWGRWGYTASNSLFTVPTKAGLYLLVPGLLLQGDASSQKIVNVYAASGYINFVGYVNRHSV
tara:strand:+ start:18831 stop:19184 length:354 start_codon:yes stop_codon:yes gene_type:complete